MGVDASPASGAARAGGGKPVAIVDIGSNSVRLVAYEGLSRAPRQIFNEKSLCALGDGVATTGLLSKSGMEKALAALRRFKVLCEILDVGELNVLATAAARDAANGPEFLAEATQAIGAPISLLSGPREAELSAHGVVSGVHKPDGLVGDLGGGSLEMIDVKGSQLSKGVTLPLGGLTLIDASKKSARAAARIVRDALADSRLVERLEGRTFYAVGGTWRAFAKLHMRQRNYPLAVMHGYVIPAQDAADFANIVARVNTETLLSIDAVNAQRRPLLPYGAAVIAEIIRRGRPKEIMISSAGVREGLLYEKLDAQQRREDPLLRATADANLLFSRAPAHAHDLCDWTDHFIKSSQLDELPEEKRLRHAACLLADVNWRAHPDYRSEESINLVENSSLTAIDHSGRAFLALTMAYRYLGLDDDEISPQIRALASARVLDRARIVAAMMRLAYIASGAMPGVLPRTPLTCAKNKVVLTLPIDLADLASDRLYSRVKQLARLIGRDAAIAVAG
ncbi:exopolyphosphatase [Methylocella silvestris]|uniref:exopolyphosphatase n=1 Tax=Methylocella silvestris TaxID=199596 RepID=A0A2J7TKC7_METSI|nr:exopolyphosphatase [Methylocella silvestris]PNG27223.1 exopolyphosphatase [Methylocella silvestris]